MSYNNYSEPDYNDLQHNYYCIHIIAWSYYHFATIMVAFRKEYQMEF